MLQTCLSLWKMGWFFEKHYFGSCVHGATLALTGEILHHALSLGQRCTLESNETVDCSSSTLHTYTLFKTFSTGIFFFSLNIFKVSHPCVDSSHNVSFCQWLNTLVKTFTFFRSV